MVQVWCIPTITTVFKAFHREQCPTLLKPSSTLSGSPFRVAADVGKVSAQEFPNQVLGMTETFVPADGR